MNKVLIGADPEIFIGKAGVPLSAFGLIKGTKATPEPVENGAVQVDGMALEFNIKPAETEEDFVNNITSVMNQLKEMVPDYEFINSPSVFFPEDYMRQQPYEALELGCEPDFNAFRKQINPRPDGADCMRTAGGHIHIGMRDTNDIWDGEHVVACENMTRLMDEEFGVFSLLWDGDDLRRKMYGKSSTFRPKTYGVEYRSGSNAWLRSPKLIRLAYQFTMDAVNRFLNNDFNFNDEVPDIIDNSMRDHRFFENNPKVALVKAALA